MDTRADPLGVCTHRSSFTDSPTLKKTNVVASSKKEMDLGQTAPCGADNVQDTVLHIPGSVIGGNVSTISPSAGSDPPFSSIVACR